jgi:hypothetical protein
MSQPKFQAMSQKELQNYMLAHRDDQEAFYAYIDRLHQEGNWIEMPPVDSVEDLEKYPEFAVRFRKNSQPKNES